jgi:hypothetical protein
MLFPRMLVRLTALNSVCVRPSRPWLTQLKGEMGLIPLCAFARDFSVFVSFTYCELRLLGVRPEVRTRKGYFSSVGTAKVEPGLNSRPLCVRPFGQCSRQPGQKKI